MTHSGFKLNRKALFALMVLAAAGAMPVQAATLVAVPTAVDGALGDNACSLREAVMQINAGVNSADCVNGTGDVYGTNDTITLPAGTYNLTITGLDEGYTGVLPNFIVVNTPNPSIGDIDIMRSVRIVGAGADATIIQWGAAVADADRDRIFHVFTTIDGAIVNVAMEGVTIQGGRTFEEFIADGPPASDPLVPTKYYLRRAGGGLAVGPGANVVLIDPALEGSENAGGRGGSQRPTDPESGATFALALTGVKVLSNQAQGDGAGIYTASPMAATNVLVSGNTSTVNGGGIYNEGATSITNSTISGNRAEGGGGLFLTGSNTVTITGTTLSGNRAIGGGAVSGRSGVTINMVNSTISGNLGDDVGAGFYSNGPGSLRFVTIANNVAGADAPEAGAGINVFPSGAVTVSLKNVLLAANKKGWDPLVEPDGPADPAALPPANCGYTGGSSLAIISNGHNLSSDLTCTTLTEPTDRRNIDPKIGALADNSGPTFTHALLSDSPALSAGAPEVGVTTDQRGQPRETPPDIGAFELDNIGGGGGGCAAGGEGRLDPTLPALAAAGLVFFGLRRFKASK